MTPLHIACKINNEEIVKLLLDQGDKVNKYVKNIRGFFINILMRNPSRFN